MPIATGTLTVHRRHAVPAKRRSCRIGAPSQGHHRRRIRHPRRAGGKTALLTRYELGGHSQHIDDTTPSASERLRAHIHDLNDIINGN
jgi:hypothetical protein